MFESAASGCLSWPHPDATNRLESGLHPDATIRSRIRMPPTDIEPIENGFTSFLRVSSFSETGRIRKKNNIRIPLNIQVPPTDLVPTRFWIISSHETAFLDASVGPSVCPSVRLSVFFQFCENGGKMVKNYSPVSTSLQCFVINCLLSI